ncbi:MAG: hypothetical protein NUV49_04315, partial [Patescibacteria group bacterium]|nr:hypothetical protein [Patescibacteria group bacterium]
TANGTPSNYKVLRYYRSGDNNDEPWKQADGNRTKIAGLLVDGRYWLAHRLTVDGRTTQFAEGVMFRGNNDPGGQNSIFNRGFVTKANYLVSFSGDNRYSGEYHKNTLQNSVVTDSKFENDPSDRPCVAVSGWTPDIHIINNELSNCSDGVVPTGGTSEIPGLVIENNDTYITGEWRTDGGGVGTQNNNGEYACAENGIDIKQPGTSAKPIKIIHNRVWGHRLTDSHCADGSVGEGIIMNGENARWVLVKNNIIMDIGFGIAHANPGSKYNSVIGNILYNIHSTVFPVESISMQWIHANYDEWYFNTVVDAQHYAETWDTDGYDQDARCNILVNANDITSPTRIGPDSFILDMNAFYNSIKRTWNGSDNNIVRSAATESNNAEYCFYRKLLTNPEQVCIPYAKTTTASPHYNQCSAGVGQRSGIGIDNRIWTWADTLFNL